MAKRYSLGQVEDRVSRLSFYNLAYVIVAEHIADSTRTGTLNGYERAHRAFPWKRPITVHASGE